MKRTFKNLLPVVILFFGQLNIPHTQAAGIPEMLSNIDILSYSFSQKKLVFDTDLIGEFSSNPMVELEAISSVSDLGENLRSNLDQLVVDGTTFLELVIIEGNGNLWFASPTLLGLEHADFDYDSRYADGDPDNFLTVDSTSARKRFVLVHDSLSLVLDEAHARDLKVVVNIESLAHVINRATGGGIGSNTETTGVIADNLPAPDIETFRKFLAEVLAMNPDAISAEAYSSEFDLTIQEMAAAGIPFWHTGSGIGDVWSGYYYSLYPTVPEDYDTYIYLHTDDGLLSLANLTFAHARAESKSTSLVLGAYNPLPCDLDRTEAELFSTDRELYINPESPQFKDGASAENCATEFWRNLMLFGVVSQRPEFLLFSTDLEPSVNAFLNRPLAAEMTSRLMEHPYRPAYLPVANIVIQSPNYDSEIDGFSTDDYLSAIDLTIMPLVTEGLEAAGFKTVLTFDQLWSGGNSDMVYLVTPGGNESNDEEGAIGAPYYNSAQDIPSLYTDLLDSTNDTLLIIHPVLGMPDTAGWAVVRNSFGLPAKFAYKNSAITNYEEGQTSLVSSQLVDSNGEPIVNASDEVITSPILPASESINGRDVKVNPYIRGSFGQTANLIDSDEVPAANIFYSGSLLLNTQDDDGSNLQFDTRMVPYVLKNGSGKFLINISQLHSELFTWLITSAIADATASDSMLAAPARVQMRGGLQTLAIAYDQTELQFNMPVVAGTEVRIRIYDHRGILSPDETIAYSSTITRQLQKRSLLVAEAHGPASYSTAEQYLYLPAVDAGSLGVFDLSMILVIVDGEAQLQVESVAASSFTAMENTVDLATGILSVPQLMLVDESGATSSFDVQLELVPRSNPVRLRAISVE